MSYQNAMWKLDDGLCRDILGKRVLRGQRHNCTTYPTGRISSRAKTKVQDFKTIRVSEQVDRLQDSRYPLFPRRCLSCDVVPFARPTRDNALCDAMPFPSLVPHTNCALCDRTPFLRSFPTRISPCAIVRRSLRPFPTRDCVLFS